MAGSAFRLTGTIASGSVRRMAYAERLTTAALGLLAAATFAVLSVSLAAALEPHPDLDVRFGVAASEAMTDETFLDLLMMAESAGRDDAKNPLSTAVGPYQFINATFLDLARRHFSAETAALTTPQVLALRTDRAFARRAAAIYTSENARQLAAAGLPVTYPHLRLAFLVGPVGAIKVLQAPADTRVAALLGASVIRANPFMSGLTAAGLVARSARDLKLSPDAPAVASAAFGAPRAKLAALVVPPADGQAQAAPKKPAAPKINVRCNLDLASCRKWVALQTKAAKTREAPPKRTKAASLR